MPKPLTRTEVDDLRRQLTAVAGALDAGDLDGSGRMRTLLDGALVALAAVAGDTKALAELVALGRE